MKYPSCTPTFDATAGRGTIGRPAIYMHYQLVWSQKSKQVRPSSRTDVYPQMPILRVVHAHARVARAMAAQREYITRCRLVRFWASEGAKFSKLGDFLPRTPMNHLAIFDAAKLYHRWRNPQTYKQANKQTNNSNRYIHILLIGMCG